MIPKELYSFIIIQLFDYKLHLLHAYRRFFQKAESWLLNSISINFAITNSRAIASVAGSDKRSESREGQRILRYLQRLRSRFSSGRQSVCQPSLSVLVHAFRKFLIVRETDFRAPKRSLPPADILFEGYACPSNRGKMNTRGENICDLNA